MARPKKAITPDMLRIVDSFYESHGDAFKIKFKSLEYHAKTLGLDIKEYDFRRDETVKLRIAELKNLQETLGLSLAYKTLNADALINSNPTRASLKAALVELDSSWRAVYDRAVMLSSENTALLSEKHSITRDVDTLRSQNINLKDSICELRQKSAALLAENRYLKSVLENWLYPDIASEILKRERVIEYTDSKVTDAVMEALADKDEPASLNQIVAQDSERMTKAQSLIERMKSQVVKGLENAEKTTG